MNLSCRGSSLSQYAIILGLLIIALVPGFYLIGNSLNTFFQSFSEGFAGHTGSTEQANSLVNDITTLQDPGDDNSTIDTQPSVNNPATYYGGMFGGTPQNPVKDCSTGTCMLDFGSYILTGIPDNFNNLVETSGVASATTQLADLMMQIAHQLAAEGKIAEAEEVKKLAVTGHNIALIENEMEKLVNGCNGDATCLSSLQDKHYEIFQKPAGYDETYNSFPSDQILYSMQYAGSLGSAINNKINDISKYNENLNLNKPEYVYTDQLETVLNTTGISDEMKGVIRELSWDLGIMGEEFQNNYVFVSFGSSKQDYYDPLTGTLYTMSKPSDPLFSFQNYEASKVTNFDAALICASASYADTGTSCH